jgi:hypothetical protein
MTAPAETPSEDVGVMEVAIALKVRYAKARDLMLQGKIGTPHYRERKLHVSRKALETYLKQQEKK